MCILGGTGGLLSAPPPLPLGEQEPFQKPLAGDEDYPVPVARRAYRGDRPVAKPAVDRLDVDADSRGELLRRVVPLLFSFLHFFLRLIVNLRLNYTIPSRKSTLSGSVREHGRLCNRPVASRRRSAPFRYGETPGSAPVFVFKVVSGRFSSSPVSFTSETEKPRKGA